MGKNNRKKPLGKLREMMDDIIENIADRYIEIFAKRNHREPTEREMQGIYKKARETAFKKVKQFGIRAVIMLLNMGITFGAGFLIGNIDDIKGITDGDNSIKIEGTLLDNDKETIEINDLGSKKVKIDGIVVDDAVLEEIGKVQQKAAETEKRKEDITKQVEQEIEQLNTKEEVFKYIKQRYADVYNESHEDKITDIGSIGLSRSREGLYIYQDGDICRITQNSDEAEKLGHEYYRGNNSSYIVLTAETENGEKIKEAITDYNYNGDYYVVYNHGEEVPENQDNTLIKVAGTIDKGIDVAVSSEQEETSWEVKEKYKNRLKYYAVQEVLQQEGIINANASRDEGIAKE